MKKTISDPISTDGGLTWHRYISTYWEDGNTAGIYQKRIAHIDGVDIE